MGWSESQKKEILKILATIVGSKDATEKQFDSLKEFTNNSSVGASKLLHFICPAFFPIWDSRVAKAFFGRKKISYQLVNKTKKWKIYTDTLREWTQISAVQKRCKELRDRVDFPREISDIRLLELVLFHKSFSKKIG